MCNETKKSGGIEIKERKFHKHRYLILLEDVDI